MGSWAMGSTLRGPGRAIRDCWCPQGPDKFQRRVKVSGFLPCKSTVFPPWSPLFLRKQQRQRERGAVVRLVIAC